MNSDGRAITPAAALHCIPLEDAEIYYLREFPLPCRPESIMKQLIDEVPWRAENIVLWENISASPVSSRGTVTRTQTTHIRAFSTCRYPGLEFCETLKPESKESRVRNLTAYY